MSHAGTSYVNWHGGILQKFMGTIRLGVIRMSAAWALILCRHNRFGRLVARLPPLNACCRQCTGVSCLGLHLTGKTIELF